MWMVAGFDVNPQVHVVVSLLLVEAIVSVLGGYVLARYVRERFTELTVPPLVEIDVSSKLYVVPFAVT